MLRSVFSFPNPVNEKAARVVAGVVLVISAILGALVVNDGRSTWQEGVVLVGFYVVIAASFWWGT